MSRESKCRFGLTTLKGCLPEITITSTNKYNLMRNPDWISALRIATLILSNIHLF